VKVQEVSYEELPQLRSPPRMKEEKTRIVNVTEGFDFSGFHFDSKGRVASIRTITALEDKRAAIAKNTEANSTEDNLFQIEQALLGWKNYFSREPAIQIQHPLVYTALLNMVTKGQ
jgi:hypothetical protein